MWPSGLHAGDDCLRLLGGEAGEAGEGGAAEPVDGPLVEGFGAEGAVEVEGGLVPVEDGPLEAAAAPLLGEAGDVDEEGAADAAAPELRADEYILEVDTGAAGPGREAREVDGVGGGGAGEVGDQGLGGGPGTEEGGAQGVDVGGYGIGLALVGGELADQIEEEGGRRRPQRARFE